MKVIYTKSILEKIQDANNTAEKMGRTIEKIILSHAEWKELGGEFVIKVPFSQEQVFSPMISGFVMGIPVEVDYSFGVKE